MRQASQSIIVIAQHRLLRILDEESRERLASIANLRDYDANEACTMRARMRLTFGLS